MLLYRRGTGFQHLGKRGDGKLKVVTRYSWALDYNGIEGPRIAKRRKGFEIIMQLKHCRVAFKYKNLYREKTILCALCNWLTSLMLYVSSFLYGYGHFTGMGLI